MHGFLRLARSAASYTEVPPPVLRLVRGYVVSVRRDDAIRVMSRLKAFVVEDNAVIRESLIAALEELAPVEVIGTAEDERGAVEWLDQGDDAPG